MEAKKERNSNYELMRIISMFLIVLYHVIYHGNVVSNYHNNGGIIIIELLEFLTLVHVNSFVLVSGYYQSTTNFKQSKLWSIINATLFYKITIMLIFLILGLATMTKADILLEIFPINITEYWFIKNYFLLYCLSPFINKSISNIDKTNFKNLLIVLFILFVIIPTITGNRAFDNNGFTLYHFVFLYLIGAYIRKYPLENNYLFKIFSKKLTQIILISIFIICIFSNYILYKYALSIEGINSILDLVSNYINRAALLYNNPLVLIQSISYFLFFGTLTLNSKIINKLSALTTGVYLIHDNNFCRNYIYTWLKIDNRAVYSYKYIVYILVVSIIIYMTCSIIEEIRQKVFKKIYNLKISYSIRNRYYKFLNSIYILRDKEVEER